MLAIMFCYLYIMVVIYRTTLKQIIRLEFYAPIDYYNKL